MLSHLVDMLPTYFTMSVASKRNSGKSYFIQELLKCLLQKRKCDMVLVMSQSAGLNDDYSFLPDNLLMPFSEKTLARLWELQKATPTTKRRHVIVVLDDCLSNKDAISSQTLQNIFTLGRHLHISCIVASQVSNWLLSPVMKANSDFILWSKLNRQQLENLWASTSGISKQDFLQFSQENGGIDYAFCVLNNYSQDGSELFSVRA